MALVILEGLDRTGKTTVAKYLASKGYEIIHMSAPTKGTTPDLFLEEMVTLISRAATSNICLDRSYYGEACIWPQVYNRESLLSEDNLEVLREIENSVDTTRILMVDPKVEEHWKRCVDNNEPLTKAQFLKARALYNQMSTKYDFEQTSLTAFIKENPEAEEFAVQAVKNEVKNIDAMENLQKSIVEKTPEQLKLEKANAINEILSKRILKQKGDAYDSLEQEIRLFLNTKLGQLFGTNTTDQSLSLSKEEIVFYKTMFKRAMKENNR